MKTDQKRERLACAVHDSWSHWMRHIFSKASRNADGSWTIPADSADRWQRQMETDYAELTESEKDSDRRQADKLLDVIQVTENEQ